MEREELERVVAERKKQSSVIREHISVWARQKYGIDNLLGIVQRELLAAAPAGWRDLLNQRHLPVGVLYRSIASVTIEEVAVFGKCFDLGLTPVELSYVKDSFSLENAEKVSRLRGLCEYERSKGYPLNSFSSITGPVIECHRRKRVAWFSDQYPVLDLSEFYSQCLRCAEIKPRQIFSIGSRRWIKTRKAVLTNGQCSGFRPPARWILPVFLSLFLDGRAVWLESADRLNPDGSNGRMVQSAIKQVTEEIGYSPVIVTLPARDEQSDHLLV